MRRYLYLVVTLIVACAQGVTGQDDGAQPIRKALEGRLVLVKMDLPAIVTGVEMIFDDANVSFDHVSYNKLVKEYGVSLKKGSRSKITGVRISSKGIEIDLDGGGSPGRDWLVGNLKLTEPPPLDKSGREVALEHQLMSETNASTAASFRIELEYERQKRLQQDERNRAAFERVSRLRSEYIEENRKNWGSKLIIVVRSRKESVTMRDMVKSLAQYVEFLPREPVAK